MVTVALISCLNPPSNNVEISFWGMGAEGEAVQKLIPDFIERHPDINVKIQMIPWTAGQEKLITAYASDNLPDVFQLGNTWIPQFVALNALEILDPWIAQSTHIIQSNYFEGIWETNIIEKSVYGIPWYIDTRVLFYRTDVICKAGLERAPQTWAELYQISKQIKKMLNDPEKYAIYLPTNEWAPFVIFGLQNGSKLLKENNTRGNFSAKEFAEAFNFLIQFHKEKLAPIGISQVTNVYQAFADEYFSMYISGPWNINEFKKWMTGNLSKCWMTAPLPGPNSSKPGLSLAGGSSLVISKNSTKKNESWQLIEFLSQPRIQIKFFQLLSNLPAVRKAWEDSLLQNDPYIQAFFTQFHQVISTPKVPEWEQIAFSKIQQYAEIAARGDMSVEEALTALDEDVDRILEKRRWLMHK
jgi:multiple sugar transport system substrate-binding protein